MRLLVVCPSWVGDAVMATPALRRLRSELPGAYIGALVRPGIDHVLDGLDLFDEVHTIRSQGFMGPKRAAAGVRGRGYDTALLLTNSFSTALSVRMALIGRRVGYDRDGRGVLLTDRLTAPKTDKGWAVVPAVSYYWFAAGAVLGNDRRALEAPPLHELERVETGLPPGVVMELGCTDRDQAEGSATLASADVTTEYAILNPGGNNPAKRWPAERFCEIGKKLSEERGWRVLVNGAPAEIDLCTQIAAGIPKGVALQEHGHTLRGLKHVVCGAKLMVTNDTGPRHFAVAAGVPTVSLFGPTDPRWTTVPTSAPEAIVVADPTLDPRDVSNDHPERCAIERVTIDCVAEAIGTAVEI
ncbi:MAG: glycosyltransferase family 9 protein [Planctomycetota bacterium]